jgi:hypothetical protein
LVSRSDTLQIGDNVSELVNDAGYITSALQAGDNVSELTNDAGYITSALQAGDNVSELTNDAGYLTSIPTSFQDLGIVTAVFTSINVSSGENIYLRVDTSDIELSLSSLVVGRTYSLSILNIGATPVDVTFSGTVFYNLPIATINTFQTLGMTLMAVQVGINVVVITTGYSLV